ncbi:hypothetical protein, partial [Psychrobacillus psychrodurans]
TNVFATSNRRSICFRSDEEAEAKPTESEVVVLADFSIQLYAPKIEFVYSLNLPYKWRVLS